MNPNTYITIIIITIKNESAVQGWERVKTLYQFQENCNNIQPLFSLLKGGVVMPRAY